MTATLSPADLPLVTLPAAPRTDRIRRALRAFGRSMVRGLATDNGWFWAYGVWYPYLEPPRSGGDDHRH